MSKKIKAEATIKIDDGKHTGKITAVEFKDEPYEYTDIIIKEKETEVELKCGVPSKITENTALGIVLENFGINIKVDDEYDVEEILKGKEVEFLTKTEKTEKGTFARIISDTLKPKK